MDNRYPDNTLPSVDETAPGNSIFLNNRLIPPRGQTLHYEPGHLLGDFIYLADKPGGVEPGFLAVQIDELLLQRYRTEIAKAPELNNNTKEIMLTAAATPARFITYLESIQKLTDKRGIQEFQHRLTHQLLGECLDKINREEGSPNLRLWLIKQDYQDPQGLTKTIHPPLERLMATNAISQFSPKLRPLAAQAYALGRASSQRDENINAIKECIANEIANKSGMITQNQHLVQGSYLNGQPKIMTACEWNNNMEVLKGHLAGSKNKNAYENYLVQKNPDGSLQSDNTIIDLGENFPLIIALGDRDKVGSLGQNIASIAVTNPDTNKLTSQFFGFDFGHAFPSSNPILDSLSSDFSFQQPTSKNDKFKNLSLFSDTALSEKMKGVFYLFKMSSEADRKKIFSEEELKHIENAIHSYKQASMDFATRFDAITPGVTNTIFDKYIEYIESKIPDALPDNKREYTFFISKIKQAKEIERLSQTKMLTIFKERLQTPYLAIHLLDHLELITADTHTHSTNGLVLLHQLRVTPGSKTLHWEYHNDMGLVTLVAKGDTSALSQEQLNKALNFLSPNLTFTHDNGQLRIRFHERQLSEIANHFTLEQIKAFKTQAPDAPKLTIRKHTFNIDDTTLPNTLEEKVIIATEKITALCRHLFCNIQLEGYTQFTAIPGVRTALSDYLEGSRDARGNLSSAQLPRLVRDDITQQPELTNIKLTFWIQVAYQLLKQGNYMGLNAVYEGIFRSNRLMKDEDLPTYLSEETIALYQLLTKEKNTIHRTGKSTYTEITNEEQTLPSLQSYAFQLSYAQERSALFNDNKRLVIKEKISSAITAKQNWIMKQGLNEQSPSSLLGDLSLLSIQPTKQDEANLIEQYIKTFIHWRTYPEPNPLLDRLSKQILALIPEATTYPSSHPGFAISDQDRSLLHYIQRNHKALKTLILTEMLNAVDQTSETNKIKLVNCISLLSLLGEKQLCLEFVGDTHPTRATLEKSFLSLNPQNIENVIEHALFNKIDTTRKTSDTPSVRGARVANIDDVLQKPESYPNVYTLTETKSQSEHPLQGLPVFTSVTRMNALFTRLENIASKANEHAEQLKQAGEDYSEFLFNLTSTSASRLHIETREMQNLLHDIVKLAREEVLDKQGQIKQQYRELLALNTEDNLDPSVLVRSYTLNTLEQLRNQYFLDHYQTKNETQNVENLNLLIQRCQQQWTQQPENFTRYCADEIKHNLYLDAVEKAYFNQTHNPKDEVHVRLLLDKFRQGLMNEDPERVFGNRLTAPDIQAAIKLYQTQKTLPLHINFAELGEKQGKITEGVHAIAEERAGIYEHPVLGKLFVKKDSTPEKNLTEWAFYKVAECIFKLSQQQDVLDRMAPIVLITENTDTAVKAQDIFVGSLAHDNITPAWEKVYEKAKPGTPLPHKRPRGFESRYETSVQEFIKESQIKDDGFSMLPLFELLAHHATHLGNLFIENTSKELLFFDYGAAAWYDLQRQDFDHPHIRGKAKDKLAEVVGVTKHYMKKYEPAILMPQALTRLDKVYDCFKVGTNLAALRSTIQGIISEIARIGDEKTILKFGTYLGVAENKLSALTPDKRVDMIAQHLFESLQNRIKYIPTYKKTHGQVTAPASPKPTEDFIKEINQSYTLLETRYHQEKSPALIELMTALELYQNSPKTKGDLSQLYQSAQEAVHDVIQDKNTPSKTKLLSNAVLYAISNEVKRVTETETQAEQKQARPS